MTSIKVKFRPSTVDGKEGGLYFQIIHNRVVRQLNTDYKVRVEEWDTEAATHNIVFKETSETGHTIATVGSPCIRVKKAEQGIIEVRNVDFTSNPDIFKCRIRGNGSIAITTGKADNATFAEIESSSDSWQNLTAKCQEFLDGVQTLYIILKGSVEVDTWSFGN